MLNETILCLVPPGWYIDSIKHVHTRHTYRDDVALPMHWQVNLQHVKGGRLTVSEDRNLDIAFAQAIEFVKGFHIP